MTKSNFNGVFTALLTPFKDGAVDKKSFARLIKQQLDQGVEGFVVNGTTGESPTLTWDEVRQLFQIAKTETGGSIPLIVGTGLNSTARTCELSREASQWRPDALLVVVPYYNRPVQRGLLQHFTHVAQSSSVPILLYNVPTRTVANLEPETVAELSRVKNIVGIKDATGDMTVHGKIKAGSQAGFTLLSGDDATSVEYCARGGHGVISVSSHIIGKEMREYFKRAWSGDAGADAEFKKKYADLMKWLYIEPNPIPVKMAMYWLGIFDSPEIRLPLTELDEKYHGEFKACLRNLGKM